MKKMINVNDDYAVINNLNNADVERFVPMITTKEENNQLKNKYMTDEVNGKYIKYVDPMLCCGVEKPIEIGSLDIEENVFETALSNLDYVVEGAVFTFKNVGDKVYHLTYEQDSGIGKALILVEGIRKKLLGYFPEGYNHTIASNGYSFISPISKDIADVYNIINYEFVDINVDNFLTVTVNKSLESVII